MLLDTQCKCINDLDFVAYTKWWKNRTKKSKLHMPHNTSNTFNATYGNPVTSFAMYMCKGTFSRTVYTTIRLMNTRALSGEEVALMWKITTRKYITVIGKSSRK